MAGSFQQVAEAVVALIESGETQGMFAHPIVAERAYDTTLALEDASIISVYVVPVESDVTRISENTFHRDIVLDIVVRKRFNQSVITSTGSIDLSAVDPYIELLEQIHDWLGKPANHKLPTFDDAFYIEDDSKESDRSVTGKLGIRWPYHPDHLRDMEQYTGILRVAYHVEKEYA